MVTIDHYPDETISFANLPEDCPIQKLDYGGILTMIGNKVAKIRKQKRDEKREFLITMINNTNMGILIDSIHDDAKKLPHYLASEWRKGKKTKAGFLEFFKKTDLSLKYLVDLYEYQNKGKPVFKKGEIFKDYQYDKNHGNYAIVDSVIGQKVKYTLLSGKADNLTYVYMTNGRPETRMRHISIWKCKIEKDFDYSKLKNIEIDYNLRMAEIKKRMVYWKSKSIFRGIRMPYDYCRQDIDIFNGETPRLYNFYSDAYRNTWHIIRDVIMNECV
jgi:hypothetical protein